jgi:hypothetical protein
MANQVAARLAGDDYQHLYAWWHALNLLAPATRLVEVDIEDEDAGSFDDVTLFYDSVAKQAPEFFQVKYHVDLRNAYSTEVLCDRGRGSSLLQKFWRTWQKLGTSAAPPTLTLFSNWSWDSNDAVGSCIDGRNGSLTEDFLSSSYRTDIGKLRDRWLEECQANPDQFSRFARSLKFRLGSSNADEDVCSRVSERMERFGLRTDSAAMKLACGVVREGIKRGAQKLTKAALLELIETHDLRAKQPERTATVYLETIKKRRFDLAPDYLLDWRDYFEGPRQERGHAVTDPALWSSRMLPELQELEEKVNTEINPRLIRARGLSRLSAWFAFGRVFSRVSGYEIEVQQGGALWRSDASPSPKFEIDTERTDSITGSAKSLAVGISVTGSLDADVSRYLASHSFDGAVLLIRPKTGPSRHVFHDAGDVVAFAMNAKSAIRQCVDQTRASEILLFYFGPLCGACFLGHDLNALGANVTIMEDQSPGYAASFRL